MCVVCINVDPLDDYYLNKTNVVVYLQHNPPQNLFLILVIQKPELASLLAHSTKIFVHSKLFQICHVLKKRIYYFACKHADLSGFGQSIFSYKSVIVCVFSEVLIRNRFLEQYLRFRNHLLVLALEQNLSFRNNLLVSSLEQLIGTICCLREQQFYYEQYVFHSLWGVNNRYGT